jgi:hypothetical protein
MPVYAQMAENVTVLGCDFEGNAEQNGIFVWDSDYFIAESCNFTGIGGSWLGDDAALKFGESNYYDVIDCEFVDIAGYGVASGDGSISAGFYGEILDCTFINATAGIFGYNAQYVNVTNNDMLWCDFGILSDVSDDWRVEWNTIEGGNIGISRYISYDWLTANNTIRWNNVGIDLLDSFTPGITADNIIALNFLANGRDNQARFWDDGVDTGNYWDDWSGVGVYNIDGGGGAQDRFPMQYVVTEPIINTPMDVWMAEGSVDNEIEWLPFDDFLKEWDVTVDGEPFAADIWNFESIIVNIDSLTYGTHIVFITVWDVDGNYVNDTVIVHVYDDTPPEIFGPGDTVLFIGVVLTLEWDVSDLNPTDYVVNIDGTEYETSNWTSGVLSINFDGIDTGEHNITMTIYDVDGNMASDLVAILVIEDDTNPDIDSPADLIYVEGTTGNVVVWEVSDDYPDSFDISSNASLIEATDWDGGRIVLNVDGLPVGTYEFTVTVYDMSGNSATDSLNVTVIPLVQQPDIPMIDWVLLVIVGAVVGAVVVVVIIIYYLKKKRPAS